MNIEQQTFRSPTLVSVVKEAIDFFNHTPLHPLPPTDQFEGTGVYALYYTGDFELYRVLAQQNTKDYVQPIYVGKAVPDGWRAARTLVAGTGHKLSGRLREHARSIGCTTDLQLSDFRVRFMILNGIEFDLVVPVEAELIRQHTPLWNCAVDGFGNHDPGGGRYGQAVSEWDVLHPGRPWVKRLTGASSERKAVLSKVKNHLAQLPLA